MRNWSNVLNLILLVVLIGGCNPSEEVASTRTQGSASTEDPQIASTQEEVMTPMPPTEPLRSLRVGVVSDVNGFDDGAWNAGAWGGLVMARDELGVEIAFLESTQESDYATHIATFIEQGYDMIVTVGASMAEATQSAAEQNPETHFVIVDFLFDPPIPNVLGLTFSKDMSAFLAGYLGAGMTKSGVVSTFGAFNFPPITIYMVGFRNGVDYYNQQHATSVEVLGMDRFIENFDSLEDGRRVTEEFINAGADIILPVAGPASRGSAEAVMENPGTMFIGVDFDWCIRAEEFCTVTLTSIFNPIDKGVFWAVQQLIADTLEVDVYSPIATLPFHEFEDAVPQELKQDLETIHQGLMDGSISTGWTPPE